MNETYDHETLKAIIQEAKRQGYDDKLIALNLGIARNDPAFGYVADDQLRASISELQRRGIHWEGIAERLGLPLEEVVRLHGDDELRPGLFGGVYRATPGADHHPDAILKIIERGRVSLVRKTHNGTHAWLERSNPTNAETLALLVDSLGLQGAHNLIASCLERLGNHEPSAAALHIPSAAAKAVLFGCFPTAETAPTLQ